MCVCACLAGSMPLCDHASVCFLVIMCMRVHDVCFPCDHVCVCVCVGLSVCVCVCVRGWVPVTKPMCDHASV